MSIMVTCVREILFLKNILFLIKGICYYRNIKQIKMTNLCEVIDGENLEGFVIVKVDVLYNSIMPTTIIFCAKTHFVTYPA